MSIINSQKSPNLSPKQSNEDEHTLINPLWLIDFPSPAPFFSIYPYFLPFSPAATWPFQWALCLFYQHSIATWRENTGAAFGRGGPPFWGVGRRATGNFWHTWKVPPHTHTMWKLGNTHRRWPSFTSLHVGTRPPTFLLEGMTASTEHSHKSAWLPLQLWCLETCHVSPIFERVQMRYWDWKTLQGWGKIWTWVLTRFYIAILSMFTQK